MKSHYLPFLLTALTVSQPILAEEAAPAAAEKEANSSAHKTQKVEKSALEFDAEIEARVLPTDVMGLVFKPEVWSRFSVIEALAHGSPVSKGESVIKVDTEALEEAIVEQEAAVATQRISLESAKESMKRLLRDHQLAEESSKRSMDRLLANHKRFLEVSVPLAKREVAQEVDQMERRLEGQEEELRQLTKMYAEDELTEETEEIILERAKNTVADYKFALEKVKLSAKKKLETDLPREVEDYQLRVDATKRQQSDSAADRQVAKERNELEVAAAQRAFDKAAKKLKDMKSDLELASFKASRDGYVFYGIVDAGAKWNLSESPKRLVRGGSLAPGQPLFTIVPKDAKVMLSAQVDAPTAARLAYAKSGIASLEGSKTQTAKASVISVSDRAGLNGTYGVTLEVASSDFLTPGSKVKVKLSGKAPSETLVVPKSAIKVDHNGKASVEVLDTDEKFVKRTVKTGLESADSVQIVEGLKAGDKLKSK